MALRSWLLLSAVFLGGHAEAKVFNYETDGGAKPGDDSWDTVWKNGAALNSSLAALKPGDTFVVPDKTFYLMGGIQANGLHSVHIQIDGTLTFATTYLDSEKYLHSWPRKSPGNGHHGGPVFECMEFA